MIDVNKIFRHRFCYRNAKQIFRRLRKFAFQSLIKAAREKKITSKEIKFAPKSFWKFLFEASSVWGLPLQTIWRENRCAKDRKNRKIIEHALRSTRGSKASPPWNNWIEVSNDDSDNAFVDRETRTNSFMTNFYGSSGDEEVCCCRFPLPLPA